MDSLVLPSKLVVWPQIVKLLSAPTPDVVLIALVFQTLQLISKQYLQSNLSQPCPFSPIASLTPLTCFTGRLRPRPKQDGSAKLHLPSKRRESQHPRFLLSLSTAQRRRHAAARWASPRHRAACRRKKRRKRQATASFHAEMA